MTFRPIWPRPCVRATLVVVLPSPALVGVMAVTMTSLPSFAWARRSRIGQLDLAAIPAERLELVRLDAGLPGDLGDVLQRGVVGDVER